MKKHLLIILSILALASCNNQKYIIINDDLLKFNEGSVAYGSSILLSNFGTNELNPLNTEGKGYVLRMTGENIEVLIPSDGNLSAPKGMAIEGDYLYIADVGKVVVYNLENLSLSPVILNFPEGNLFVNDIAISGNTAYVSVTNTGKIFAIDISNPKELDSTKISEYIDVVGANGLLIDGNKMYIASYPADGNTTKDNVIYEVEDMAVPVVEKLIQCSGQYDGLALSGDRLFFTNWVGEGIGYVDLTEKKAYPISVVEEDTYGAADIVLLGDKLYVPILPANKIVVIYIDNL